MFSVLLDKSSQDTKCYDLQKSNAILNIALIGLGTVTAYHHIPGMAHDPRVSLVAICDEDPKLLETRKTEWGIPKATSNYLDIVNDKSVDAVVIATPNFTHFKITQACIKAGKHVLLEKPIGINSEEAIQLAIEAEAANVVNMTAFTYRFTPALRYIKHLISSNQLGQIRHFRSQRFLDWPETSLGWRQYKSTAGAGTIYDMLLHRLDFSQYLLGPIKSVSGKIKNIVPRYQKSGSAGTCKVSDVDDWVALICEFQNGATGVFESSTLMKGHFNEGLGKEWAEINGSLATAVYQLSEPNYVLFGTHGKSLEKVEIPGEFLKVKGTERKIGEGNESEVFRWDQMSEFVSGIIEKRRVEPSFLDGALAQIVADAAIRSSEERRDIEVVLPKGLKESRL